MCGSGVEDREHGAEFGSVRNMILLLYEERIAIESLVE